MRVPQRKEIPASKPKKASKKETTKLATKQKARGLSEAKQGEEAERIGARGPRVEEPLIWAETYPIQWREPRVDLAELARLRV